MNEEQARVAKLAAVIPLRSAPPLTDIAGQLRQLADRIEHGEAGYADVRAAYVVLECDAEFQPMVHAWGEVRDRHGIAGLFLHVGNLALTDKEQSP